MNALAVLILIGAVGFIFGRFLFLRPRPGSWMEHFFLSGVEFLLLGALVGPQGFNVFDTRTLFNLEPFAILALSWVGLLVGMQLRVRHLVHFPLSYFRVAFTQGAVALLLSFGALAALLLAWTPVTAAASDRWRAALCLAAVAALSSPTAAAFFMRSRARAGHAAGLLRFIPAIDPLVSLAALAVLFAAWHVSSDGFSGGGAMLQWIGVSLAGGVSLGVLFIFLLRIASDRDEVVLVVLGMAVFSGGMAAVFHLSPLVVCLAEGIVLSNTRGSKEHLLSIFLHLERPLYVALLVLAGAAWRFDQPWGYVLAAIFLLVRVGGKYLGWRAAATVAALPFPLPRRWWMGLLPQGGMAVAIAVSYFVVYRDPLAELVFSAILVSTAVLTLASGPLLARALPGEEEIPR